MLKETPIFSKLKIEASCLNVQTFIDLIKLQEKNRNVRHLLVFKVDEFHADFHPEFPFENSTLGDTYAIGKHHFKPIPSTQSS